MQKCRNAEMQKCITDAMNKGVNIYKSRKTEQRKSRNAGAQHCRNTRIFTVRPSRVTDWFRGFGRLGVKHLHTYIEVIYRLFYI